MSTRIPFLVFLMSTTLLVSCEKQEEAKVEEPRPVLSIVAASVSEASLSLPGTIEARIETEFGFRVLGRVIARNVHVGDLVKRGDVLAATDPLTLELAVRSAQSDLANAEAQLASATITEARQKTLFEKQSGAKSTYEVAVQQLKSAQASVAKAKANLSKAKEQLGYSQLLAEFDGVVTKTSAEVGQVVSPGQSIVTVAQPEERDAVIDVPEAAGYQLKPGTEFDVALQLDSRIHAKGIVREIAPQADEATRTQRTRLTLVDPPQALRLGAVISASVTTQANPVIQVPMSAIRSEGGKTFVWTVDEKQGKVASRPVTLGNENTDLGTVTVTEGISSGERIVVAGVNKLKDGQAVRMDQEITN
jgi:membrane fusion protein, multidrug efflux system